MDNMSIFDLPNAVDEHLKPIKSTDWKWTIADDYPKKKNGLKVFSCFACGGGSTMGYKLTGCDVVGCCTITGKANIMSPISRTRISNMDILLCQTFPEDYDFLSQP